MMIKSLALTMVLWCSASAAVYSQDTSYVKEYDQWQANRLKALKAPYGWTSVVGLYSLDPDQERYSFGSSVEGDLTFPAAAPPHMGQIHIHEDQYIMSLRDNVEVMINGRVATGEVQMRSDQHPEGPNAIHYKSLQWYLIDRRGKKFIRMRDTLSPYRQQLTELTSYEVDPAYIINGTYHPPSPGDSVTYSTIVGIPYTSAVAGYINFELHGATHRLTALPSGEQMYFLIIADETTGVETYGGGRFMYVPKEDTQGKIVLDFNRAINPPCVFTPYATCPLPPDDNVLPVMIEAGEKMIYYDDPIRH